MQKDICDHKILKNSAETLQKILGLHEFYLNMHCYTHFMGMLPVNLCTSVPKAIPCCYRSISQENMLWPTVILFHLIVLYQ